MCCALIAATRDMPHLLGAALDEFMTASALSIGHPDPSGYIGPVVLVVEMSILWRRRVGWRAVRGWLFTQHRSSSQCDIKNIAWITSSKMIYRPFI